MMFSSSRLAAATLLGLLLACGDRNLGRGAPCESSDACDTGLTCAEGACRAPCNLGSDCPEGNGCSSGLCMPLAAGTCGQTADCKTPPDACHTAFARCTMGKCEYTRAATPQCLEECVTAATCSAADQCEDPATARCVDTGCVYDLRANGFPCTQSDSTGVCFNGACIDCLGDGDCDPRDFGHDLCWVGACVNQVCSFVETVPCSLDPMGSPCFDDDECRTGYCTNGRCCESRCHGVCSDCGNDGRCDDMPADDDDCGVIDCDGRDTTCRDYFDYDDGTGDRCYAFGACVQANSVQCGLYSDAPGSTECRAASGECDIEEYCDNGTCPTDDFHAAGDTCDEGSSPPIDAGRCDGGTACRRLVQPGFGVRYFLDEALTTSARSDFFGNLDLAHTGTGTVNRVNGPNGAGLTWNSVATSVNYCSQVGSGGLSGNVVTLTYEVSLAIDDLDDMPKSMVLMLGPVANRAALLAHRAIGDPPGQVSFFGIFGDGTTSYSWTTTIAPVSVIHLTFDGAQAASNNALRLYVDGVLVAPQATPAVPAAIVIATTDSLCLGNDNVVGSGAFIGTIYYAAAYSEVLSDNAIMDATLRLLLSDD